MAKTLILEIKYLKTILDLEATRGLQVPYLAYTEMQLKIPEVRAFDRHVLMLVVPDSSYCQRVPVMIGTLFIDMLMKLATQQELEKIGHCWKRGAVTTMIAMHQMQNAGKVPLIDQIDNDVKLTKNVTI